MAGLQDFVPGMNQDLIINDWFNLVASEIYSTYGQKLRLIESI